jgi:hypothetical protein
LILNPGIDVLLVEGSGDLGNSPLYDRLLTHRHERAGRARDQRYERMSIE